jgi:hypothetical protein
MATGRTVSKYLGVFFDGYALAGYTKKIGPLKTEFQAADVTTLGDTVKGFLPNQASVTVGTLNGIFDNTAATGLHVLASGAGVTRIVSVPIGIRAAMAQGDPCFNAQVIQDGYQAGEAGGAVIANVPFGEWAGNPTTAQYPWGWGLVLNANTARVGVNAASGVDNYGAAVSTLFGGYLCYHVTAGNGTATLSIDDSADNAAWVALSGATTGSINCAVVSAGIVALGRTATVRRYLRWQIVLGTATTVTFLLSFVRAVA